MTVQKLSKVAAPDPFTSSSSAIKEGARKVGGGNALLSRPGPSKTTFGPPSAGGSKNRFTVRYLLHTSRLRTLHLAYADLVLSLCITCVNSRTDLNVKIANRQRHRTGRNTVTVRPFTQSQAHTG